MNRQQLRNTRKGRAPVVRSLVSCLARSLLIVAPAPCLAAMQALDESQLAEIAGSDGVSVTLSAPSVTAASVRVETDSLADAGGIQATGLRLSPLGGPATVTAAMTLDVGAPTISGSTPAIALTYSQSRARLGGAGVNGFQLGLSADPSRSFGNWALVSDVAFTLVGMPLYGPPGSSMLRFAMTDATLFYRQHAYPQASIAFDDLDFSWEMPAASIDITDAGLVIAGDANLNLDFDLMYKFDADQDMTTVTANDRPVLAAGWRGQLKGADIRVRGGGIWNTSLNAGTSATFASLPAASTEGVNAGMRWNYGSDVTWRIGHASGDREYLEYGDWRLLEHNAGAVSGRYGLDFPLIAIDSLNAASASNAGGGLCWGGSQTVGTACTSTGSLLNLTPGTVSGYTSALVNRSGAPAVAVLVRNGNLTAWPRNVKAGSTGKPALDATFNLGHMATFANINANIYLYPGGNESDVAGGSRNHGVIADVLLMSQSVGQGTENWTNASAAVPTRWSHGTHFLMADTDKMQGTGLLGSNLLLAADDLRLWIKNTTSGVAAPANYLGGIDLFSPRTRFQLSGLLGTARLPGGLDLVRVTNLDMNIEGMVNFRLSPQATGSVDAISFSSALRLQCGSTTPFGCYLNAFDDLSSQFASGSGSWLSMAEPGRPDVDLRWADMSGDLAITEGRLSLLAADETGTGKSAVRISGNVQVGISSAARVTDATTGITLADPAGRPMTSNVRFGGNDIFSMAIPAATFGVSLTVRPQ